MNEMTLFIGYIYILIGIIIIWTIFLIIIPYLKERKRKEREEKELERKMERIRQHTSRLVELGVLQGGIISESTHRLLRQTPADPHLQFHQEQEQERPTPEQLERLAQRRLQSFAHHVQSLPISISHQDVDRWREAYERQDIDFPPQLNQEQENARQDYIATIDNARNALREQGITPPDWRLQGGVVRDGFRMTEPKQPLMDRKYPHACHECKNPLQYRHAFGEACKKYDIAYYNEASKVNRFFYIKWAKEAYAFEKQFKKWWKHPVVKFMCCSCFRKATKHPSVYINSQQWITIRENLERELECSYDENGDLCGVTAREDLPFGNYEEP